MDNKLRSAIEELHSKTLHHRSIEAIIASSRFERLWEESSEEEKEKAILLIEFGYKSKLLEWIKEHPSLDLGERSLNYLRERGKQLGIKNYSRLQKSILILEISKNEEQDNETNKRGDS